MLLKPEKTSLNAHVAPWHCAARLIGIRSPCSQGNRLAYGSARSLLRPPSRQLKAGLHPIEEHPRHNNLPVMNLNAPRPNSPQLQSPFRALLLFQLGLLLAGVTGQAQGRFRWEGSGGWAHSGSFVRRYDTDALVTVQGTVTRLETFTPERGMSPGVRAVVQSGAESVTVHFGPKWFVERQDIQIDPKDEVLVTGSRITVTDRTVIAAATVVRGEQTLQLRDTAGVPLWSGGRTEASPRGRSLSAPRWTLQLPEGDLARGKTAYRNLWCHGCHVAKGHEKEFPAPYAQPAIPVVLGLEPQQPSRMELVNSLINPSHRIEPNLQKELVTNGQFSRMGDYNEIMTLQQLSDLVTFLEALRK
jgi:hypothetical protein